MYPSVWNLTSFFIVYMHISMFLSNFVFTFSYLNMLLENILMMIVIGRRDCRNDGLLAFVEKFLKDHFLPAMFVDYRKCVQQVISSKCLIQDPFLGKKFISDLCFKCTLFSIQEFIFIANMFYYSSCQFFICLLFCNTC